MAQVRLRVLGESVIEIGGFTLEPSATHLFALALYLAVERGRLISRRTLAATLFPDAAPRAATHNLRQLIYRLRRHGAPIESTQAAVRLPADCVTVSPESTLEQTYDDALRDELAGVLLPGYAQP